MKTKEATMWTLMSGLNTSLSAETMTSALLNLEQEDSLLQSREVGDSPSSILLLLP